MIMRKILVTLAVAAITLILGIVLMTQELFDEGALLIFFSIILAALANTEYKHEKKKDKRIQYSIYSAALLWGLWVARPGNLHESLLAIPLLILYGVTTGYLLICTVRAWRNKA